MPTFTTSQKVAIALSIPVAGVFFYFLLKWVREDDEYEDSEVEFVSSSDLVSEMQIQQCHVGAVIGNVVFIFSLVYLCRDLCNVCI